MTVSVSVVIPTKNEARNIERCLRSIVWASDASIPPVLLHLFPAEGLSRWYRRILFCAAPCLLRMDVRHQDVRTEALCESSFGELTTLRRRSGLGRAMWPCANTWQNGGAKFVC